MCVVCKTETVTFSVFLSFLCSMYKIGVVVKHNLSSARMDCIFMKSLLPRTSVLWLGGAIVTAFVMWALDTILLSMSGWYLGAGVIVLEGAMVASFRLNAQLSRGVELSDSVVPTP